MIPDELFEQLLQEFSSDPVHDYILKTFSSSPLKTSAFKTDLISDNSIAMLLSFDILQIYHLHRLL